MSFHKITANVPQLPEGLIFSSNLFLFLLLFDFPFNIRKNLHPSLLGRCCYLLFFYSIPVISSLFLSVNSFNASIIYSSPEVFGLWPESEYEPSFEFLIASSIFKFIKVSFKICVLFEIQF